MGRVESQENLRMLLLLGVVYLERVRGCSKTAMHERICFTVRRVVYIFERGVTNEVIQ